MLERSRKFASASQAWRLARRAAQAKAKRLNVSLDLVAQEARWRLRGDKYMRKYPALRDAWIKPDPRMYDAIATEIEKLPDQLIAAYDTPMASMAFRIWRETPVGSGLTRASWNLRYFALGDDKLVARLENGVPYWRFIKSPGWSVAKMNQQVKAARDEIVAELKRQAEVGT